MCSYHRLEDEDTNITVTTISNNNINVTLIWLDEEALNSTSPNTRLLTNMFKTIVGTNYDLYNDSDLFLREIPNRIKTMKTIVIMSGRFAENILNNISQPLSREISSVFIFCKNSDSYQHLFKTCRKLTGIYTDEESLKEAIKDELYPSTNFLFMDQNFKPIFSLKDNRKEFDLYKQYIKLLQEYPWSSDNREKMLTECSKSYEKDNAQQRKIKDFTYSYRSEEAIQWYTKDCFLYRLVNKALRSLDMDQINIYRPFIKDLCSQLERLHQQNQSDTPLVVYRGYGNMTNHLLNEIKENIGALISFNGFLSTSTDYNVAMMYAGSSSNENKSVIFEIQTNYGLKNVVFANISQFSHIEDENEVLFSLCSIFRINNVTDDEENNLSKLILIATDEDPLNISQTINQEIIQPKSNFLSYCQQRYLITTFSMIVFILITIFVVIFAIKIKSKDNNTSNSYDCIAFNCSTTSSVNFDHHSTLTSETHVSKSTKPLISTRSTYIDRLDESKTSLLPYCFPVGWKSEGDVIVGVGSYKSFAVDDDFNVYVQARNEQSLQKWSSDGELIQEYFKGNFGLTSLFFHSPSQSLYFCYRWDERTSIYKLNDNYSKPVRVVNNTNSETIYYQMDSQCGGLYVNSIGEIFVFSISNREVIKWTPNSSVWRLVATVFQENLISSFEHKDDFVIDEGNNMIYTLSIIGSQIVKYKYGSRKGMVIFDETIQQEIFSDTPPKRIYGQAFIMDKTGYILLATTERICLLTTDGKFNVTLFKEYKPSKYGTKSLSGIEQMAFDKLGNLYIMDMGSGIVRFNRTSTTCTA